MTELASLKSRVSQRIADSFKITHLSLQSLLIDYIAENPGDEDALEIKRKLMSGLSPSDSIVNALVGVRMSKKDVRDLGLCIDTYPNTEAQVDYMRSSLQIEPTFIFMLECSDNFIFKEQLLVDSLTGKSVTLEQARASNDPGLLNRISELARESKESLQNSIETWDLTRRTLFKHFENKVISINIENISENQVIEKLNHTLRKMF